MAPSISTSSKMSICVSKTCEDIMSTPFCWVIFNIRIRSKIIDDKIITIVTKFGLQQLIVWAVYRNFVT